LRRFPTLALVALLSTPLSGDSGWQAPRASTSPPPVPGFFDLSVTGGLDTYQAFGLVPEERGVALALLARQLHSQGAGTLERSMAARKLTAVLGTPGVPPGAAPAPAQSTAAPITIAAPLTADHWREQLELPDRADLFPALVTNRAALLVAAGTMAADPSVRALLERDRGLLRFLMRTAPGAFWLAARSLRVGPDRFVVPGGAAAEPIWEALAGERVTRPADFIRALVSRDGGRLAWFFDTVAGMDPDRLAAAFGPGPLFAQAEQARAFYSAFRAADQNWKLEEHPFLRGVADPWMAATQVAVANGAVAGPTWQWLWEALFDRSDTSAKDARGIRRTAASPVTLAWITQKMAEAPPAERRYRFKMVRFAQTVFPRATEAEAGDLLVAIGGYRRYESLLLTLDRMDITAPKTFARAVEAARRVDDRGGREQRQALILLQAALAIVERARITHAIDAAAADRLVLSLADLIDKDAPPTAMTRWITTTLVDALPPLVQPDRWTGASTAYESRILQAMAGPPAEAGAPAMTWEGLSYQVDLAAGERQRLARIREQIESPGLDAAIASGQSQQIREALLALVYTPALGDPEGAALLSTDVAQRHEFGFDLPSSARRDGYAWTPPREQVGAGAPWHIQGSLLGLDLGLARLALRRIADNEMPVAPSINLNDQITLARTIGALDPRTLRDTDRDRLVDAVARGRRRLAAATTLPAILELAGEARVWAPMRETLPWLFQRAPEAIPSHFALRDLLWLGKPDLAPADLDRWGVYSEVLHSRLKTVMPGPAPWDNFGGRPDGGVIGTQTPDLTLRIAEETARLKLPARLVPALLAFATQDYWHDVTARFPDDWPAMTRQAIALSASRVEDYVAALAGGGPLRPK
jgi:hypothetical protein